MIPAQIIEEIRNKADIVKIISEYIHLKKRGKNYLGLCPFHSEKDASFTVSPEKQIFHCFGCKEGGNVFAFIMKLESISFTEAVEEIGTKVGVSVPQAKKDPYKSDKDKIYQVMLLAAKFYQAGLAKTGDLAKAYLKKRGLSEKTSNLFGLGFAPPGWDNLFQHLIARGVAPELMAQTGLILAREGKSGYYDRFRNRLIIPIIDQRNRVIAFGGRSLGNEEPKYLNSSDTLIYHKSNTLFGLNLAKDNIKKSRTAILVEGYFDQITPFQAGITNIVASLGTAYTTYQCKLLARYCDTVILAFDADAAGGIAAERSVELMKTQGLKIKVAQLTGGKDPDEIIVKQGKAAWEKCLEAALPFLEFKITKVISRFNLKEIEGRAKAMREIALILSQEKDLFVQKEYAKLAAVLLKVELETVLTETKRLTHYQHSSASSLRKKTAKPNSKVVEAEKSLLNLASQDSEVLALLKSNLSSQDFSVLEIKSIIEMLFATEFKAEANISQFLMDNLPNEEAKKFLSQILISEHLSAKEQKQDIVNDCLNVIKAERAKTKIGHLKLEIKAAEASGKTKKVAQLLSLLKSEIS